MSDSLEINAVHPSDSVPDTKDQNTIPVAKWTVKEDAPCENKTAYNGPIANTVTAILKVIQKGPITDREYRF
jgi:hypothetical protein